MKAERHGAASAKSERRQGRAGSAANAAEVEALAETSPGECKHFVWTWDGKPSSAGQARYIRACVRPWPSLEKAPVAPAIAGSPGASPSLVTTSISQQDRIEVFPVSLRVKRYGCGNPNQEPPDRSGSWIGSFSDKSRRRLRFRAVNAFPALVSQFGLTYHNEWPTDGRTSKAHLNAWLTALRRLLPGVGYLWLLEFQKRNAPHYHVFLTVPPDESTRLKLADAWCRITSPGDPAALRFHQDARNWIAWDMGTGAYLCKYLDKEAQKAVPEGYHGFGRFWGNSRGLEPEPVAVPLDDLDESSPVDQASGEIYGGQATVIRWLGRLAEKQTRGYSRFRSRAPHGSYTILQGASAYKQIELYFSKQRRKQDEQNCPF